MQAIAQFRARYPQGGLIGEFLALEGGNYLVRVTVQNDETVLATGLAAAETIELAEDRARQRALAALGIGSPAASGASPLPPATPEAIAPPTTPAYPSAFPDLDLPEPVPTVARPASTPPTPTNPADRSNGNGSTDTAAADLGAPDNPQPSIWEARAAATAPAAKSGTPGKKRSSKAKKSEPAPEPATPPTPAPPAEPTLDAAEIVTRAKAELKRLGWTREQGQKFLLERYGKRETRQLDDREWRDFYDYLYQQPNPVRS